MKGWHLTFNWKKQKFENFHQQFATRMQCCNFGKQNIARDRTSHPCYESVIGDFTFLLIWMVGHPKFLDDYSMWYCSGWNWGWHRFQSGWARSWNWKNVSFQERLLGKNKITPHTSSLSITASHEFAWTIHEKTYKYNCFTSLVNCRCVLEEVEVETVEKKPILQCTHQYVQ